MLRALESAPPRPAYLLHGEETFLVERAVAALRRGAGDRADAARTLWADEDASSLPSALDDLSSPLLFGGAPLLVLRHAEALGGRDEERVLAAVERLDLPARLILVARVLDARRKLLAALERAGGAVAFPRVTDPRALRDWVGRMARERGRDIHPAALDLMLENTALDLAGLEGEVEKAALFAGPGIAITPEHVAAVGSFGRNVAVEQLANRVAAGDRSGAQRAIAGLLEAGEPPVRIVAFLASSLRRALHVAELAGRGFGRDAIAARLGMPGWLVDRVGGRASAAGLEGSLDTLRILDSALKRSRPPAAVFHAALEALTAATAPRRP